MYVCAFICAYIYKRSNNQLLDYCSLPIATLGKSAPTLTPHSPSTPPSSYGGGGDGGAHQKNAADVVFTDTG